jgi:class 3 adenylate cyclase
LEREFNSDHSRSSLSQVRVALALALGLYAAFGFLDGSLAQESRSTIWLVRYAFVSPLAVAGLIWSFNKNFVRHLQTTMAATVIVGGIGIAAMIAYLPADVGYLYYAGLLLVIAWGSTFAKLRFVYASLAFWAIVAAYGVVAIAVVPTPTPILINNAYTLVSATLIGMVACYSTELYARTQFYSARLLKAEQERSERLLLNILPGPIADRLKADHATIADSYSEVTVLFADIVNFTEYASHVLATDVVSLLNDVFSLFDHLADVFGVEKIKTIGDAYMAVAGVPTDRADHAEAAADLALAMIEEIKSYNRRTGRSIVIRIGINSGPVVAGVIGTRKFIYDLWGDTVNIASRMESNGVPGQVQVTEATHERLRETFVFDEERVIDVKGRGKIKAFLLAGRRAGVQSMQPVASIAKMPAEPRIP